MKTNFLIDKFLRTCPIRHRAIHVRSMRAERLKHFPTAHPDFEAEFQIFGTPNFKARIVITERLKIIFPNDESCAQHCRRSDWIDSFVRHLNPCVKHIPVEAADVQNQIFFEASVIIIWHVAQRILAERLDGRESHRLWVRRDWV